MNYFHKKFALLSFPILFLAQLLVMSCLPEPLSEKEEIEKILMTGTWSASLIFIDGNSETEQFKDWTLSFKENGEVDAVKIDEVFTGAWEIHAASSFRPNRLVISFQDQPMAKIATEWRIVDYTRENVRCENIDNTKDEVGTTNKLTIIKSQI